MVGSGRACQTAIYIDSGRCGGHRRSVAADAQRLGPMGLVRES